MEDHSLIAVFSFDPNHQSYPERTHGGLISALIDETVGRAIWIDEPKTYACTIKLEVSFHKAVPYGEKLYCVGRIDKRNAISFEGHAEIKNKKGELLANGKALYMKLKLEQIAPNSSHSGHLCEEDLNIDVPDDVKEINI